jgi:hypothetical protein
MEQGNEWFEEPIEASFIHGHVIVSKKWCIAALIRKGFGGMKLFHQVVPLSAISAATHKLQPPVNPTEILDDENIDYDLILLNEEACYLFTKNKLILSSTIDGNQMTMTLPELWVYSISKNDRFPVLYKAYEYFRNKM